MNCPKVFGPLVLIWLTAASLAQSAPSTLNYTTVAVPLTVALSELSKQTGEKLLASDELAKEPIVLRLTNAPTKDSLDKIASVMSAEWIKTDKGLELRRTDRIATALTQTLAEQNLKGVEKSFEQLKGPANAPPLDENSARQIAGTYAKLIADEQSGSQTADPVSSRRPLSDRTAEMHLLAQMLLALGAERIAALPVGYHAYSFHPNAIQQQMEGLDESVLTTYLAQRNLLAEALTEALPKNNPGGYIEASSIDVASTPAKGPVKPVLVIEVSPSFAGPAANLYIFDKDGSLVSSASVDLSGFDNSEWLAKRARAIAAEKGKPGSAVTPVLAEFAKRSVHSNAPPAPFSATGLEILCHPESHDPLSLAFSEGLLAVAGSANENLVATTSDSGAGSLFRTVRNGTMDTGLFMVTVGEPKRNAVEEANGWLTCKPCDPLSATSLRTDREALGHFIRALNEKGFDTIEDWANVAQGVPYPDRGYFVSTYQNIWRGDTYMPIVNDMDALRFYGSLSDGQLMALKSGPVDCASLGSDQQQILSRMLYSSMHPSIVDVTSRGGRGTPTGADQVFVEPTEAVPNGIPEHALLTMKEEVKDQFYVTFDSPDFPRDSTSDLQTLAYELAAADLPPQPGSDPQPKVLSLKYGSNRVITFSLNISDHLAIQPQLTERRGGGSAIPVEKLADQLPSDVWERLKKMTDDARERMKDYLNKHPGAQPQTLPPPPPPRQNQ